MTDYRKVALKAYNRLALVVDGLEDEGDRVYLGSTNDADVLKELKEERDAHYIMDEAMRTSEEEVVIWRTRALAAEAEHDDLRARLAAAEAQVGVLVGAGAALADGAQGMVHLLDQMMKEPGRDLSGAEADTVDRISNAIAPFRAALTRTDKPQGVKHG